MPAGNHWLPRIICCCLTRFLFTRTQWNTMQRRTRKIPLHQIQNPPLISCYRHLGLGTHRCLPKQPSGVQNASSVSPQDQRHMSVRQRFRRYLQHGPRASIHHAFQSFAKLAVCYARHTAKHFFTASLGRKNTKINGRSSLQRLLEVVKTLLEIFWAPGVARCRAESSRPWGQIYMASNLSFNIY